MKGRTVARNGKPYSTPSSGGARQLSATTQIHGRQTSARTLHRILEKCGCAPDELYRRTVAAGYYRADSLESADALYGFQCAYEQAVSGGGVDTSTVLIYSAQVAHLLACGRLELTTSRPEDLIWIHREGDV